MAKLVIVPPKDSKEVKKSIKQMRHIRRKNIYKYLFIFAVLVDVGIACFFYLKG